MSTQNNLAAKVIGDIIAEGMSISEFDVAEKVSSEAINALNEIKLVLHNENADDNEKMRLIDEIMKKYRIN